MSPIGSCGHHHDTTDEPCTRCQTPPHPRRTTEKFCPSCGMNPGWHWIGCLEKEREL